MFRKRYGKEPTSYDEMGYVAAKVVTEAMAKVKGNVENVPAFLQALRRTDFLSPQGRFRFDDK